MNVPADRATGRGGCLLGLLSLLISLLAVEVLLRLLHPLPDPFTSLKVSGEMRWPGSPYVPSAYPPHYLRRVHAERGLPGIDSATRVFSLNNLGYRGDSLAIPKPPGEVRVFMIGGSTTECVFLDDSESVTARLQTYLRAALPGVNVRVYGAGKSGDRSWDHVAMAAHRVAHLQPDVIVVFAGINDALAGVRGRDYLLRADLTQLSLRAQVEMVATEFQLGRLAQSALSRSNRTKLDVYSSYHVAVRLTQALPLAPLPAVDPTPYRENLQTLAGIGKAAGAHVVLMTQATTWGNPGLARWHWMTASKEAGVRYPETALAGLMRRYNAAMLTAGQSQGVPVFDLAAQLPGDARYIYDDVHFNVRGADTTAVLLARFMVAQGVIRPAATAGAASAASPRR
jgi:lysophospholipase L1-like esterase